MGFDDGYGCFQQYGKPPKSSYFNRVFHYFHHAFWGVNLPPLFLVQHPICLVDEVRRIMPEMEEGEAKSRAAKPSADPKDSSKMLGVLKVEEIGRLEDEVGSQGC